MKKIRLGIVGLGLIGGSILKALSKRNEYEIYAITISSKNEAKSCGALVFDDIEALKKCDIIFVCTKISKTLETLERLNSFLNKNTIVADVCSIKKEILNKKFNFNFILSHPMAGSEKQGFSASDENLFKGAKWLIDKKTEKENEILEKIIKDLGAIPYKIDMSRHDEYCVEISHLPSILSSLLFFQATDDARKIASSGFRDMTRLSINSNLNYEMFKKNENNILKSFDKLIGIFDKFKNLKDEEKIDFLNEIAKKRMAMYDENGKNKL